MLEDDSTTSRLMTLCRSFAPRCFDKCADAQSVFGKLAGRINAEQMRAMNYAVDGEKKDAAAVARDFLTRSRVLQSGYSKSPLPGL